MLKSSSCMIQNFFGLKKHGDMPKESLTAAKKREYELSKRKMDFLWLYCNSGKNKMFCNECIDYYKIRPIITSCTTIHWNSLKSHQISDNTINQAPTSPAEKPIKKLTVNAFKQSVSLEMLMLLLRKPGHSPILSGCAN